MVATTQIIEYIFFGQVILSSFACLARTDFNFAFALLSYYLWHNATTQGKDIEGIGKKIFILNGILAVLDFIWLIVMGSIWGDTPIHDAESWESTSGIRSFALLVSWVNFIARLGALGLMGNMLKDSLLGQQKEEPREEAYDMGQIPA